MLSTPELIDQAYAAGEISADERLLYLAAALYAPDALPSQFQSDIPWFGTTAVAELDLALESMAASASVTAADSASATTVRELQRIMATTAATVCREEDGASAAESANFHLNYTSIGGGLSAQSYLDALETTFGVEVSSYGWAKPPYCQNGVGSCTANNPWGKYPVQAVALGGGLYGYVTSNGGAYTGNTGDNPNTGATESAAVASCMVLNNDFTGFPGGAQTSLNATAAHEFVHSIQYGGGDLLNNYAIHWIDLPTSGPYAVKMKSTSNGGQFRVSIVADTGGDLQVTAFPGIVNGNQTVTLPSYTPPSGAQKKVRVCEHRRPDRPHGLVDGLDIGRF